MSSEKSTLSAKTSQTSFSHLSTAEKVFEQSKKNFDLKTGQANVCATIYVALYVLLNELDFLQYFQSKI